MDQFRHGTNPDAVTAQAGSRPGIVMARLALCAVVLAAVPLVVSQPAPLEDWPSHLARVEILTSLLRGETFWAQYYHLNSFLLPNVALDIGLAGLHGIGLSIATAGTVFLLATYAVFIVGGSRLARAFGASDPVKPVIIAMLFYNGALIGGFANYMVGLGLAFWVFAAWIEARDRPGRRFAIAVLGTVAVFFAHLIAAAFLVAAMGLFELYNLVRQRRFGSSALLRHASPAAAAAVVVVLFVLSPTTADGPGGGGAVYYTGAPSPAGIAKGKLILLFHPLLDGSGIIGAAILVAGMVVFLLLTLRFGRPRLSPRALFLALGLALLVVVSPNGIGVGYGLDYRLVVPLACVVVCATTLTWRGTAVRWVVFAVLLVTSVARSGSFIADFWRDKATFRAFEAATAQIPPDSLLLTGMGSRWETIPWGRFWAPPAEYLATQAAPSRVFVPTVFAIASQHPLVLNSRFAGWGSFVFFSSPDDAAKSRDRLQETCADWQALGHTGRVLMLLVYPSAVSEALIPRSFVIGSGPGFELVDGCELAEVKQAPTGATTVKSGS
jgi:hypothetical protein